VPTFETEMYLNVKKSLLRHCKKLITNITIFLPVITIKLKLGKNSKTIFVSVEHILHSII